MSTESKIPENVNWAKKNNKITYGNVMDLVSDGNLNIRFHGEEIAGVTPKDTLDLATMEHQVYELGGIQKPIVVSVRSDGKKVTLQGNRRTLTGQRIVRDPNAPQDLVKALTERTPMILMYGLTPAQEMDLVYDQDQKDFLRSELVRHIFAQCEMGYSYDEILKRNWQPVGKLFGGAKKFKEKLEKPYLNEKDRMADIKNWLNIHLRYYLVNGYNMGPYVQKQILLSEMKLDGILSKDINPYFNTTKNSSNRIKALDKAREMDGRAWNGVMPVEGSEFKKVLDAFHEEDYGPPKPDKPGPKRMMARTEVESLAKSFHSRTVTAVFERILGNEVHDLSRRDNFAAVQETKLSIVEEMLPHLKPEMAVILRFAFTNADPVDFKDFLEEYRKEVVTEQPMATEEFELPETVEESANVQS